MLVPAIWRCCPSCNSSILKLPIGNRTWLICKIVQAYPKTKGVVLSESAPCIPQKRVSTTTSKVDKIAVVWELGWTIFRWKLAWGKTRRQVFWWSSFQYSMDPCRDLVLRSLTTYTSFELIWRYPAGSLLQETYWFVLEIGFWRVDILTPKSQLVTARSR